MSKKPTTEEIDKLVKEKLKQYAEEFVQNHKALVITNNGNTYISFKTYDYIVQEAVGRLCKLLDLIGIESYATYYPDYRKYGIVIDGDDANRAAFIQKFIDDNYVLKWE